MRTRRSLARTLVALLGTAVLARPVLAHVGALGGTRTGGSVPTWFVFATGGGVVGVTFLFSTFMTDDDVLEAVAAVGGDLAVPDAVRRLAVGALRAVGVAVLALVVVTGLAGPTDQLRSFAILVVWVGWWAGYTMSTYLLADTWPLLNPWRTLAAGVERLRARPPARLPERLGSWPAVVGLLGLVLVEVVSPVAQDPRLLAVAVGGYTVATLGGAAAVGAGPWFRRVDPIARLFRCYGRLAPVGRGDEGLRLSLPTAAAVRDGPLDGADDVAFVVAVLWATTFDGLVATPAWEWFAGLLLGGPGPLALALYAVAMAVGYAVFYGGYRLAARLARRTGGTYVATPAIERWFAPALLPIAAGYHLAHFLPYFLQLSPALVAVAANPFAPPEVVYEVVLPSWFGWLQLGIVVLGHMLAVWVAHALAFALFPGRFTPIRSQYPFVVLMIGYTMTSLWIVAQPWAAPPFVG